MKRWANLLVWERRWEEQTMGQQSDFCPSCYTRKGREDSGCWEVGQAAGSSKRLFLCYRDGEGLLLTKREECMKRERLKLLEPV